VFSVLAQTVSDIRPGADDVKPLDAALEAALKEYTVAFHLVPLPKFTVKDDVQASTKKSYSEPYPTQFTSKGKGKHKSGKGGKASGSNAAPKGFHGCVGRDAKNRPICFDYNISSCNKAPAGGSCPKGRHVCFRGGCFKAHAFHDAHGSDMPKAAEVTTGPQSQPAGGLSCSGIRVMLRNSRS
jgi:hypothetical protein